MLPCCIVYLHWSSVIYENILMITVTYLVAYNDNNKIIIKKEKIIIINCPRCPFQPTCPVLKAFPHVFYPPHYARADIWSCTDSEQECLVSSRYLARVANKTASGKQSQNNCFSQLTIFTWSAPSRAPHQKQLLITR